MSLDFQSLSMKCGIHPNVLCQRIRRGWSLAKALNTPVRRYSESPEVRQKRKDQKLWNQCQFKPNDKPHRECFYG